MSTRTLNSTGRSRITLNMIDMEVLPSTLDSTSRSIRARCDVSSLALPKDSSLFLELSNSYSETRFELSADGENNEIEVDSGFFSGTVRAKFVASHLEANRVAIISAESVAILFDGPSGESTLNSPLILRPDPDLEVPWKLDFTNGDFMVLVSNRGNLWTQYLKSSATFKALIASPLVFQICLYLLDQDETNDGAAMVQWIETLKPYGLDLTVLDVDLTLSEKIDIAGAVSERFVMNKGILDTLISNLGVDSDVN
ncbi:hypothetical protein N9K78_02835 [Aquiluna sp.]|nr:hypothetical protein [Aquiluna sp.]